jgi:hypothetical protein
MNMEIEITAEQIAKHYSAAMDSVNLINAGQPEGMTAEDWADCLSRNMTPELQRYYESRFEMMGMDGWKELCIDIDIMIESLNNLSVISDEKTLMFKKGELSILTWLKTLKEVSERAYEELNEKNV